MYIYIIYTISYRYYSIIIIIAVKKIEKTINISNNFQKYTIGGQGKLNFVINNIHT